MAVIHHKWCMIVGHISELYVAPLQRSTTIFTCYTIFGLRFFYLQTGPIIFLENKDIQKLWKLQCEETYVTR
jgi:hypothetical protein